MQTRQVKSVIVHSRYNRAVVDYDISVLELESEVEVTSYVRPICLPDRGQLPKPDKYCHITGWGHVGNRSECECILYTTAAIESHTLNPTLTLLLFGWKCPNEMNV